MLLLVTLFKILQRHKNRQWLLSKNLAKNYCLTQSKSRWNKKKCAWEVQCIILNFDRTQHSLNAKSLP